MKTMVCAVVYTQYIRGVYIVIYSVYRHKGK